MIDVFAADPSRHFHEELKADQANPSDKHSLLFTNA
jgi:hypothetical protein